MFTNEQKLACIKRELGYRIRVYRRLVDNSLMTQEQADRQIAIMQAIAEDYDKLIEKQLDLI